MLVPDIIFCTDSEGGISKNGKIPWKSATDMSFFKMITNSVYVKGKSNLLIMGKNTYASMPATMWLSGNRTSLVVSRLTTTLESIYDLDFSKYGKVFIVGGADIYNIALTKPFGKIYHSSLSANYSCDNKINMSLVDDVPVRVKLVKDDLTIMVRSKEELTYDLSDNLPTSLEEGYNKVVVMTKEDYQQSISKPLDTLITAESVIKTMKEITEKRTNPLDSNNEDIYHIYHQNGFGFHFIRSLTDLKLSIILPAYNLSMVHVLMKTYYHLTEQIATELGIEVLEVALFVSHLVDDSNSDMSFQQKLTKLIDPCVD
jgi:dihydrofolate reductase